MASREPPSPKQHAVRPVNAALLRATTDAHTRSHHSQTAASARLDSKIEDLRAKHSGAATDSVVVDTPSFQQRRQLQHESSSARLTSAKELHSARFREQLPAKPTSKQMHVDHDWRSPSPQAVARSLAAPGAAGASLADSSAELGEIQQSVQRLRAQRAHVEQLRDHNDRLERRASEQRRENEELRAELESLRGVEQENVGLLQSFKLLEERLRSLELTCREKRQELKAAHDKVASADTQRSHLEAAMQALALEHEQRVDALKSKQATLVDRIRQLERDQDAFVDKQQRLEQLWRDKVQRARQETRLEQQDCRLELEQARTESAALAAELAPLDAQVQALLATTARQTALIEDCDRALSDAKAQQRTAKASYHDQLELNGRLQEQLRRLETQLRAVQLAGESDKTASEKRVFELESKLSKRKDRLEVLQVALHERDKQLQALQRDAAAQHRSTEDIEESNGDLRRREKTLLSEVSELRIALGDVADEKKILAEQVLGLREQLETERKDRSRWATARLKLLAEFCDEENKLSSALRFGGGTAAAVAAAGASSLAAQWVRDDQQDDDDSNDDDDDDDDNRRHGSIVFG
ncbi:hypothetical protein PybrP1_011880 [[Pythium] brassicae (nom. inval.)]|nr:hypothetical protein PybrP1_011880 [[Pythium] brassicae (nom. inval.)]